MEYGNYVITDNKAFPMLPSHWEIKSGRYCFGENKEKNSDFSQRVLLQFTYGTIVRKKNQEITSADEEIYKKYTQVIPNDIMFNGLNLNYDFVSQRVGLVKENGIITSAYLSLRCHDVFNPSYANYLLKSLDAQKFFHGMGSGVRLTLGYSEFSKIQFPVPPRDEQDQIVRYLDWQLSKINKLIHGYQKEIALIEEKKRTFVFNAVTKGLSREVDLRESDIYWLDRIPAHWVTTKFARVFTEVKCKNVGMKENNLLSLSYGTIKQRDINATEGLLPESFEGYNIIEKDDIVLRLTDLQNDHKSLRTGIARERGIVTSAYTTLRNVSENESEYLQLFLHAFDLAKGFYNVGASGVRQSLGWDTIKTLNILVPPIDEQQKIVKAVYAEYDRASKAKESIEREIALLKEYRTRLISDVVTGQMDVRGIEIPDYTPADDIENDSSVDDDTIEDDNSEKEDDYNE